MAYKTPAKEVDNPGPPLPDEGEHLARVKEVEEKTSKKGDAMLSVRFVGVERKGFLCRDYIMLEGNGAVFGFRKLKQLGAAERDGDFYKMTCDPEELEGRKVWLTLVHEESSDYPPKATPDFNASHHGYRSVDGDEPETQDEPEEEAGEGGIEKDPVPF